MNFFKRIIGSTEKKSAPDAFFAAMFGATTTPTGARVTPEVAMRVPAVRACVAAITESLAGLPLIVYRRLPDGGKERAVDHALHSVLGGDANPWTSAYEFRRRMQADVLLHGSAFAFISRAGERVAELLRFDPRAVTVNRSADGEPSYRVSDANGVQRAYAREEILHLEALCGQAPVLLAREAIGVALVLEEHAARLFGCGARPGGVLETEGVLTQAVVDRLRSSFDSSVAGASNSGRTAILESGLKFKPLTLNSTDAQFLELRKFQVAEIARAFRVPLHKIGELDRATFSNIEHQSLEFVSDCLMPWLKLWEGAIRRSLLTIDERGEYFAEFLIDDLLRGDIESRYTAFSQAALNGFMTINEIRAAENRAPLPGGDVARTPLNTTPLAGTTA